MNNKFVLRFFYFTGIILVGYALIILIISPSFTYAANPFRDNIVSYITLRIIIGLFYTIAVVMVIKKIKSSRNLIVFIFSVGLISRIILIFSEPILEDDFNRYLWDGAVTVNGFNPYIYAPEDYLDIDSSYSDSKSVLDTLAIESGVIIKRINYPHIRTIYPPLAQLAFGITYLINPWSVTTWKSLLTFIDIIVFILLIVLLQKLGYPLTLIVIYWWNPILMHEVFNSGHMDILMYPFILLAILFFLNNKYLASSIMISLSVGVKIWPIAFLPIIFRKIINNKKLLMASMLISILLITIILLPIFVTKMDDSLGFVTYTKNWTNNEAIFQMINLAVKGFIDLFKINYHCSLCASRWVVVLFFSLMIVLFTIGKAKGNSDLIKRMFLIVAVLYLISPTQFPWYYTWVLPLLVLNPRISFIAYAILLPLYQLKYFWPILIWVEHIPIIIIFIIELINPKMSNYFFNQPQNISANP